MRAIAAAAVEIDVAADLPIPWWLAAIEATKKDKDSSKLVALGHDLAPLANGMAPELANAVIDAFLTMIEGNKMDDP